MKKTGIFLVVLAAVFTFTGCSPTESDSSVMRRVEKLSKNHSGALGYDVKPLAVTDHKRFMDKEEWSVRITSSKWESKTVYLKRRGTQFWLNVN